MALPKTVQRQLEAAEAIAAAQTQSDAQAGANVVTEPSQLVAAIEPPPTPPAAPATPPLPTENWEQRFKTLQGMFNAEVPALRTQLKAAESKLTTALEQIQALSAAKEQPPAKPDVDPRDIEAFGQDLMDMVMRNLTAAGQQLRTEVHAEVQRVEARVKALEDSVNGVSERTNATMEQQFYASLKQFVPDWEQVNAQQDWLNWLGETDPTFGVPRQRALDVAIQAMDASRVAAVFRQFKAASVSRVPETIETQRVPAGGGGGPAPVAGAAKPVIASKFVQTFYTDVAKGRYRGREAEAERIEAEINLAASEGRIL